MAQDTTKTATATADRDEFARQHSNQAVKQPQAAIPPPGPGPAESKDLKDLEKLPADQIDSEISKAEARVAGLKAQKATRVIQEYPKVLYHRDHAHPDTNKQVGAVTVASEDEEKTAKGHGWVHANPGEADKAHAGQTPDATQHTREDENARRDLPAQMALDQDARTGKPPVDLVVNSDAPDPGAPKPAAQPVAAPAQARTTKTETASGRGKK